MFATVERPEAARGALLRAFHELQADIRLTDMIASRSADARCPRLLPFEVVIGVRDARPYRWVRHPTYAAFLLILGAPLPIAANRFLGGCFIAMMAVAVHGRIGYEEAKLRSLFGPASNLDPGQNLCGSQVGQN